MEEIEALLATVEARVLNSADSKLTNQSPAGSSQNKTDLIEGFLYPDEDDATPIKKLQSENLLTRMLEISRRLKLGLAFYLLFFFINKRK